MLNHIFIVIRFITYNKAIRAIRKGLSKLPENDAITTKAQNVRSGFEKLHYIIIGHVSVI